MPVVLRDKLLSVQKRLADWVIEEEYGIDIGEEKSAAHI